MIRSVGVLLFAGVLLSGCGSITVASALQSWVAQSSLHSSLKILAGDTRHAQESLVNVASSANDLHTVCGVLLVDAESANASLPSPDNQTTSLLSSAYTQLGTGANLCYRAGANETLRARALRALARAGADFSEADARIATATGHD